MSGLFYLLSTSRSLWCYAYDTQLIFDYPLHSEPLEILLATKAYESIWQQDGEQIVKEMERLTGLCFQQAEIHVIVHDAQSMSGKDGVPMRLNVNNVTINEKRNALVHELAHRLLFGNGLYAPDNDGPDADEVRVLLFQGDVLKRVYGDGAYNFWADPSTKLHNDEYRRLISPVLKLSLAERQAAIRQFAPRSLAQIPASRATAHPN